MLTAALCIYMCTLVRNGCGGRIVTLLLLVPAVLPAISRDDPQQAA